MNWASVTFDWNQARAFLVTAEEGSLSAAARALGLTQPTLGRQVAALEQALGVALFERAGGRLILTGSGTELLDHVRAMGQAANRVSLAASGQSQAIEGAVSITASDLFSAHYLPGIVANLRRVAPGVEITIVAANDLRDLTRREADIAIRHVRPDQPDLIARLIGEAPAALYAAKTYLDDAGRPRDCAGLSALDYVGFQRNDALLAHLNSAGLGLRSGNFRVFSDNGVVYRNLVRAGLGVGVLPEDMAETDDRLEPVMPSLDPFRFPVWLATHRELHTSRRIRTVFDVLAVSLAQGTARAMRR